jgi:uncharacterized membrane protein YdjX (TVP38/TMEM64 family)
MSFRRATLRASAWVGWTLVVLFWILAISAIAQVPGEQWLHDRPRLILTVLAIIATSLALYWLARGLGSLLVWLRGEPAGPTQAR